MGSHFIIMSMMGHLWTTILISSCCTINSELFNANLPHPLFPFELRLLLPFLLSFKALAEDSLFSLYFYSSSSQFMLCDFVSSFRSLTLGCFPSKLFMGWPLNKNWAPKFEEYTVLLIKHCWGLQGGALFKLGIRGVWGTDTLVSWVVLMVSWSLSSTKRLLSLMRM